MLQQVAMGTSFVEIGGKGFWMRDGILELWLRLLALHLEDPARDQTHVVRTIRDNWLLASRGYFGGHVPTDLEEAVFTAEGRAAVIAAIESLTNHITGRVIVQILIDEKGKVPEANVKEAPDKLTGESVVAAARQWEFKPPPKVQGRQICYESTLSFRFEIHNGKGRVVDDPVN